MTSTRRPLAASRFCTGSEAIIPVSTRTELSRSSPDSNSGTTSSTGARSPRACLARA